MKKLFCTLVILFSISTFAQTQEQRVKQTYFDNDKNYELSCYYISPKDFKLIIATTKTIRQYGELKRNFKIRANGKIIDLEFKLTKSKRREGKYSFTFNHDLQISGDIKKKSALIYSNGKNSFYIPTKKIEKRNRNFVYQNEINKISCKVNFAMEKKLKITDSDNELHINVHPLDKYDRSKLTLNKVENYYGNSSYKSYVLLEEGNFKGNLVDLSDFLDMKEYKLVKNEYPMSVLIPASVELKVSPAGHNRYDFRALNDIEITYTGGNHNYCMWNNTREVLMSYMPRQQRPS